MSDNRDESDKKAKVRSRVRMHMYKAIAAGTAGSIALGASVSGCQSPGAAQSADHTNGDPMQFSVVCDPMPPPMRPRARTTTRVHFDFGKATLNVASKAILDELAVQLKRPATVIVAIVGHADRIGSKATNQKLSQQRAESVRDYLIALGFESDHINTAGNGSDSPLTGAVDCKGPKNDRVIACLQPDRRVEVEIAGTE